MLATEERMSCVRVIVPMNQPVYAAAVIDGIEAEVAVERRNVRRQS